MKNLSQISDSKDIITKEYLVAGYEPLLPATPLGPATKYLNGLRQWSTIPISNIDNLQTTLDGKAPLAGVSSGSWQIGEKIYNVAHCLFRGTPTEILIKTGIPFISSSHMPVIHIEGYAYGLQSPIELKIGYYVYDGAHGWCGAVSMGAWQPTIKLFTYLVGSDKYTGIALIGSIYFPQFAVHVQTEMGGNYATGWTIESNMANNTVYNMPTTDVVTVPYKSTFSQTISLTGDVTGSATITGVANTAITATVADNSHNHTVSNISNLTATAAELNTLDGITATVTELNYTDGVTSNIQTQLNTKLPITSYTASDVLSKLLTVDGTGSGLDADLLDGNHASAFSLSTHNHSGTYQTLDADLTAIATLAGTSGFLKKTAADTWSLDTSTYSLSTHNHNGTYQPLDADLTSIAGLTGTTGLLRKTAADTWTLDTTVLGDMVKTVYDPTNKNADAFSMANMVEGTTNKILTATERTKLSGIADNANNYVHPSTHSADIIVDGTTNKAYTATEKTKLAGIAAGAEVNVNADWSASSGDAQILNKPTTISGYGITDAYTKSEVDNKVSSVYKYKGTVASYANLPSTGQTTGDVYNVTDTGKNYAWDGTAWDDIGGVEATVTTSTNGLMLATDKVKLNSIAANANNYTHPTSGVTAGTYKSVTVDINGHVTGGTNPTTLAGYGITDATPSSHVGATGNAHGIATTSVNGFMSSTDKSKLDGIASNANNYTHPGYTSQSSGLYKITVDSTGHISVVAAVVKTDITALGIPAQDTTYTHPASGVSTGTYKSVTVDVNGHVTAGSNPTTLAGYGITDAAPSSHVGATGTAHGAATTSVNGFMSSTDKTKLDGIATGANAYTHPTGDGNLHVPVTSTTNNGKFLMAGASAGALSWEEAVNLTAAQTISGAKTFSGVTALTNSTASTSTTTGALKVTGGVGVQGDIYANNVYGAVWNDYAEYRESDETVQLGRVVKDLGNDKVGMCSKRLSKACMISSDTFGFSIGNKKDKSVPVAVAGRVLVWTDENRTIYKPGDCVCSGKYGTVSKMKWWEKILFPDRIIGVVSSVPNYERWGSGDIIVDKRIWVRVR